MKPSRAAPPAPPARLLGVLLEPDLRYAVLGDLEERYHGIVERRGKRAADLFYWAQVLGFGPACLKHRIEWSATMLKNYLKTALRHLRREKTFTAIHITGLAVGLACCILIASFILTELSYDRHHVNADRIFRLWAVLTLGGTPNDVASINTPAGPAMRDEFPEVEEAVRFRQNPRVAVRFQDREFYEDRVMYADAAVFKVFSFELLSGQAETALESPYAVVLTETAAARYFGKKDPIGETLRFNGENDYQVTGVMRDVPENSHFLFDILCSFETLVARDRTYMESWFSAFGYHTYLLLKEGADPETLEAKFPAFRDRHLGEDLRNSGSNVTYHLLPLTDIHLHSRMRHELAPNSDAKYITIFAFIGILILLIACFNFMNLATARSETRAREVGLRKVLGAERRRLAGQFMGESLLYSLFSLGAALVLAEAALPMFRSISDRPLQIPYAGLPWLIPGFVLLAVTAGGVAGSYPALYLSGFHPARVLQGRTRGGSGKSRLRRVLVVFQFAVSITLIASTLVVNSQLRFMKGIDLGFSKEDVLVIPIHSETVRKSLDSVKSRLAAHKDILSVAASSHVPGGRRSGGTYIPEGYPDGRTEMMDGMMADRDYLETLGISLVSGRNFSRDFTTDAEEAVLINQAAARKIGWTEPLGKTIRYGGGPAKKVVGVIRDFYFQSPHALVPPLYISHAPYGRFMWNALFVRYRTGRAPEVLEFLRRTWKDIDPDRPFDFSFLEATYSRQYRADEKLTRIFLNFSVVAVVIACLGLFGMTSHAAERRTKEIGIRKVMGASAGRIAALLAADLVRTCLIASVVTWPAAYFLLRRWLEAFPLRTSVNPLLLIAASLSMFAIGGAVIARQILRSATEIPAAALRWE